VGERDEGLAEALRQAVARPENRLSEGYQGEVFVAEHAGRSLVVKAAMGPPPVRWLRRAMLRREYRVYRRLEGFAGAPRCLGLLDGRFLVLERIAGVPFRHAELADRQDFFARLLALVEEMHRRGVAHGDLKKKDNLLVVDGREPRLIDFGAAIVEEPGFAPVNRFLFRLLRQFDLNAWVKLKYHRTGLTVSPQDARYQRRTLPERWAHALKRAYLNLRWPGGPPPKERKPPKVGGA
jgi:predicted Ser/Thr protein kinase